MKKYRAFLESIKPYGLYPKFSSKHLKIMKDGRVVSSMSLTPGDTQVAIERTLRYLFKAGHIPKANRRNYKNQLKGRG